ncbi:MAG TPA: N-acetylmuramoyl-L-alanine amidase [Bacteroidota bacterium]
MRKIVLPFFATLLLFSPAFQLSAQILDKPFIRLVVPEQDTTVTDAPRYRLSASTNPGNKVTVNGAAFKVYESGAFVGLLDLREGQNSLLIVAVAPDGQKAMRSFQITRTPPVASTRADTLMIEDIMMEPSTDLWLKEGDVLTVQMKATPGKTATFMNGLQMSERRGVETGGLLGVYRGIYRVKTTDTLANQLIQFKLQDSSGRVVSKISPVRVSFISNKVPLVGVVKGDRPFLNAGLGKDRLGGAKLSFIDSGVRLAITGKAEGQYRVALTENQEAWIPDDMVDLQPQGAYPPFSLTGSMRIYGESKFDYVAISLDDKLPFATTTDSDPTRINIDIFGAVSNTNWITDEMTATEITNVYYTQVEKNLFRLTIELRHKQVWGYGLSYRDNTLIVKVKRQPEKLDLDGLSIVVDAGHGGTNKGAIGATGVMEKDLTLAIATHLKTLLEKKGASVIMTRTNDESSFNSDRIRRILPLNADLLISIHANSIGFMTDPLSVKGVSTFYKYICYKPLSHFILDEVVKSDLTMFGNVGNFNFSLNSVTELPNVLVETAFVSNPEDEMKLLNEEFRRDIADRIVDGVQAFLDWCGE